MITRAAPLSLDGVSEGQKSIYKRLWGIMDLDALIRFHRLIVELVADDADDVRPMNHQEEVLGSLRWVVQRLVPVTVATLLAPDREPDAVIGNENWWRVDGGVVCVSKDGSKSEYAYIFPDDDEPPAINVTRLLDNVYDLWA